MANANAEGYNKKLMTWCCLDIHFGTDPVDVLKHCKWNSLTFRIAHWRELFKSMTLEN